jgi:hypothetical protein
MGEIFFKSLIVNVIRAYIWRLRHIIVICVRGHRVVGFVVVVVVYIEFCNWNTHNYNFSCCFYTYVKLGR